MPSACAKRAATSADPKLPGQTAPDWHAASSSAVPASALVNYSGGMVTSHDVARHLGLSQATVSRALRGHPAVTEETRQRVHDAARELGYRPDRAARTLVTRRTDAVGVIVADLASPFYAPAVAAIQDRLAEKGYRMALIRDPEEGRSAHDLDVLSASTVDGMIVMSATEKSETVDQIMRWKMPLVLLSRDVTSPELPAILADDRGAGELVVEHLVGLGHRDIAVISAPWEVGNAREREVGVLEALRRRGLDLPDAMVRHGHLTHEHGAELARELLVESAIRPTAIFCSADTFAFGVLDAAARLGIDVPTELSVVGFDDSIPAGWAMVNLTTVRQPIEAMAVRAVDVLLDQLAGTAIDGVVRERFPVELVVRGTTAPPE